MKKPAPAPCAYLVTYFKDKWLVSAMNAQQAKHIAYYEKVKGPSWGESIGDYLCIRAKRAPEHDAWAQTAQRKCHDPKEVTSIHG